MMSRKVAVAVVVATLYLVGTAASLGQESATATPREQLKQYIADLQKNPSDDALRERIIKLALTLDPKPATPPEVQELLGRGGQAFEDGKNAARAGDIAAAKADFLLAADAFAKASLLAPWVADYYLNVASAEDAAKDYANAIKNYNFYLEAAPGAAEGDKIRQRLGALKFELEKQAQAQATAEAQRQAELDAEREREREKQQQERLRGERRERYPFEGTWESVLDDTVTVGVLGKGDGGGRTIRIWYTGSDWKAEFVHMTRVPLIVQSVTGNHITLLWDARSDQVFQNIWPIELDLSPDRERLDGKVLSTPVNAGAWERGNHKTMWLPAAFVRVAE